MSRHWAFQFVNLFDSIGTIVACSYKADLVEENGTIKKIARMLSADTITTVFGALMGPNYNNYLY